MRATRGLDERRLAHRGGAEHDERGAGCEHVFDRVRVADAAADLDRDRRRSDQLAHERALRRLAERAVEVDDMQPIRAAARELGDQLDRPVVKHRRAIAPAGLEPHRAAAEQIDRGQQLHACTSSRSSASPTAWLFSGWNWHANRLRVRIAAQNRSPCSASSATIERAAGTARYECTK